MPTRRPPKPSIDQFPIICIVLHMSIRTSPITPQDFSALAGALGDPGRVRALMALRGRELCVCQLVELLGLAPSTVSRHLRVLGRAGLVESRKEGRWVYYRRPQAPADRAVAAALDWIDTAAPEDPGDRQRLERILAAPVEELCRPEPRSGA